MPHWCDLLEAVISSSLLHQCLLFDPVVTGDQLFMHLYPADVPFAKKNNMFTSPPVHFSATVLGLGNYRYALRSYDEHYRGWGGGIWSE